MRTTAERRETRVVDENRLSVVLSEFARTMITDFPIQRILDNLVERIVDVLPVTSAGVTLISEDSTPRYIAASSEAAHRFERLQADLGEGPCIEAFEQGAAVLVPDLRGNERFPRFTPAGLTAGLAAVFTFPLFHDSERFGALDLYRDTPGDLDTDDLVAAQTLADVAAALLLNAKAREELMATSDRFHYNAMHDPLTGLPNRLLLQERVEHAASRAKRTQAYTAVIFIDLDRFKQVNDTHGHLIGDELLQAVAVRLSALVRSSDTLARFSGDEFVFLCEELSSLHDVATLVQRIDDTFLLPFKLDGVEVTVRASVGTAYVGPGEAITADLLMRADLDMYRAKREGAGAEIIEVGGARLSTADLSLVGDLRRVLDSGHLDVAYQPIIRSSDGSITAVEALLRWTHLHRGPIAPLLMVSVAERSDLISGVGKWVLERACDDHATWLADDPTRTLDLTVNVSVRQLMDPGFCAVISSVLERTNFEPTSLVLELTESIGMERSASIMQVLVELRGIGVRLALDDFGTGYSSLSYLSKLPIQIIKIDRSFTAALDQPAGRVVVGAVTRMAHDLGLAVVAEGVETESQRDRTDAAGCDFAQGFFFAHPMPANDLQKLLLE